jgi:hypothetical protein
MNAAGDTAGIEGIEAAVLEMINRYLYCTGKTSRSLTHLCPYLWSY